MLSCDAINLYPSIDTEDLLVRVSRQIRTFYQKTLGLRLFCGVGPRHGVAKPIVVAVTVLTSMDALDLDMVGQHGSVDEQVIRLARLTKDAGLDGVVCSPAETAAVRDTCGEDFVRIVPGIRPSWAARDDQKRITTPRQALDAGATYLVIGRPITQSDDPVEAAFRIAGEMAE